MKRLLFPILVLFLTAPAFAQNPEKVATLTRISKQSVAISGDRGLFTVSSAETLNRGQFSFGYGWNNTDRTPRDIDINSFPVFASYGLHGRLTVIGSYETQRQVTARNLTQAGFNAAVPFAKDRFAKGIGDTFIAAKYKLYRRPDNVGGISLKGTVKVGTASAKKGLGTGRTDVGGDFIFSSLLPWSFVMHSSLGFVATSDAKEPFPMTIKDEIRSGLGVAWPATGQLQGMFEYATSTYVGAGASNAAAGVQNPSDIAAGVRLLMLDAGVTLSAGYRSNLKFDFNFPNNSNRHGLVVSMSFTQPVPPPRSNRSPVVSLESDSDEIRAGGIATITATGFDVDNDPLTYLWSASAGQVTGSGDKVTFNAAGLAPGKYTVRATASDGKGGVSISMIDITVTP
jgi:hypothetical protein